MRRSPLITLSFISVALFQASAQILGGNAATRYINFARERLPMISKKSGVNQINQGARQSKMKSIYYRNMKSTTENEDFLPLEPSFQLTDENLNQGNYVNIETCETDNGLLKFTKIFLYYMFYFAYAQFLSLYLVSCSPTTFTSVTEFIVTSPTTSISTSVSTSVTTFSTSGTVTVSLISSSISLSTFATSTTTTSTLSLVSTAVTTSSVTSTKPTTQTSTSSTTVSTTSTSTTQLTSSLSFTDTITSKTITTLPPITSSVSLTLTSTEVITSTPAVETTTTLQTSFLTLSSTVESTFIMILSSTVSEFTTVTDTLLITEFLATDTTSISQTFTSLTTESTTSSQTVTSTSITSSIFVTTTGVTNVVSVTTSLITTSTVSESIEEIIIISASVNPGNNRNSQLTTLTSTRTLVARLGTLNPIIESEEELPPFSLIDPAGVFHRRFELLRTVSVDKEVTIDDHYDRIMDNPMGGIMPSFEDK